MRKGNTSCLRVIFTFFIFHCSLFICFGQVASRTDGVNVFYYDSLYEAFEAAAMSATADTTSIDEPDEIALLADVVLDGPLIVDDGVHIRLVAGGNDRIIRRSGNNIAYPVIWLRGEGASLSLGKPGMEHELTVDGGFLDSPPIEAHAPLVAVNGPHSKLIMYDKVALQNNKNSGSPSLDSFYENGGGVVVWTQDFIANSYTEFIMKGGTIRGNSNNGQFPCGGGVLVHQFGIFAMEGGAIMNNTARQSGGGLYVFSNGAFKKTGGVIYGSNAPAGYRNTALVGLGTVPGYGHAVAVAYNLQLLSRYRDDTVKEKDNLTLPREIHGNVVVGKWDTPDKALLRVLFGIVLPVLVLVVGVFVVLRIRYLKRLDKLVQEAADRAAVVTADIDLDNMGLSDREREVCELLLSDCELKVIASILKLTYSGAYKQTQRLYAKLGIENRVELLVRIKSKEQ
jgi:DNA-binding CsgD family transcriptional regulator